MRRERNWHPGQLKNAIDVAAALVEHGAPSVTFPRWLAHTIEFSKSCGPAYFRWKAFNEMCLSKNIEVKVQQ